MSARITGDPEEMEQLARTMLASATEANEALSRAAGLFRDMTTDGRWADAQAISILAEYEDADGRAQQALDQIATLAKRVQEFAGRYRDAIQSV